MRIITTVTATGVALFLAAAPAAAAPVNLPAQQSTIKYSKTATAASGFGNYTRATSTVVYDSATGTYTVRDTSSLTSTSAFGTADIDAGASDATYTVYSKNGGTETLRLLNQGASNPLIALTYVDYGQWKRSTTSGTTTSVNDTYVVFGQKTPAASVPHSGTGTYTTIYDGTFVNKTGVYAVTGTGGITANFGTGALDYTASLAGLPSGALAIAGNGSIAFKNATFTASGSNAGYNMTLYGGFYGPSAQEVGGLFRINGNNGNGEGAFVGN